MLNIYHHMGCRIGLPAILFISVVLLPLFLMADPPEGIQSSEYEIKAAFLYNFVKFIEWPAESEKDSILIGILGHDPFGYIMEKVVGGKTVGGKTISIQRYRDPDYSYECHVLFISGSEYPRLEYILSRLSEYPVLTVSEIEDFADLGGMVYLFMDNKRIRFIINTKAANDAGLNISSKLLTLATGVYPASMQENNNNHLKELGQ